MRDRLLPAAGVTAPPARVRPAATASERAAGLTLLLRDTSDPPRLAADVADVLRLADAGAIIRRFPSLRASRAWPSELLILWAPVWFRSSRLSQTLAPPQWSVSRSAR